MLIVTVGKFRTCTVTEIPAKDSIISRWRLMKDGDMWSTYISYRDSSMPCYVTICELHLEAQSLSRRATILRNQSCTLWNGLDFPHRFLCSTPVTRLVFFEFHLDIPILVTYCFLLLRQLWRSQYSMSTMPDEDVCMFRFLPFLPPVHVECNPIYIWTSFHVSHMETCERSYR